MMGAMSRIGMRPLNTAGLKVDWIDWWKWRPNWFAVGSQSSSQRQVAQFQRQGLRRPTSRLCLPPASIQSVPGSSLV
jgi:hypothetical protein